MSNPVIHTRKNFGGRSPAEVYASIVFRGKHCTACASPQVVIRVQSFIAIKDLDSAISRGAVLAGVRLMIESGAWEKVPLKDGPGIRIGELFACATCRSEAERVAARQPSYIVVVFDRLPEEPGATVSVGSSLILPGR